MPNKLKLAIGNAKLEKDTLILSLPPGHTCLFAKECRSHTDRITGKIRDGKHCRFRCYAVTAESLFPNIRKARWYNFELLRKAKTVIGMANLIEAGLLNRKKIKLVRFHQSGDFFSQTYFDAWLLVAKHHPELIFYGYTKALSYWIKRFGEIPPNFKLVASYGGTSDNLIDTFNLRSAKVVFSEKEAKDLGLELDHDDTHCWKYNKDFAILLHSTQPAGSLAGKAWYQISKHGPGGYKSDYFGHYGKKKKKTIAVPVVKVIPSRQHKNNISPKVLAKVSSTFKKAIHAKI